ncbi:TetR/AcrR family transcriptional regulator [Vibrio sp. T187]|uniref:TetR/AcrR family transcriptional regulator n=1 Tax=Vibrio TaxID=662 RepID=UPI0010C9A6E7|nr:MULTISPECIES: TetR/AcrR family transcriptional regulator [Vibrio]MBW3695433.1 TetR/AcrR family transcriptional regulator [Vibrio sp. T187]
MARITKEQKSANLEAYNAVVLKIFLEEGYRVITYARLAEELGIRQSTLQGYYPSSSDFILALKGKLLPIMLKHLSFESKDRFFESWMNGLQVTQFRNVIAVVLSTANLENPSEFNYQGITSLDNLLKEHFGHEHRDILESVLGRSFLFLNQYK